MGLTRSSSGLLLRDDFGSDTSGNYYCSTGSLSVATGVLTADQDAVVIDIDKTGHCVTANVQRGSTNTAAVGLYTATDATYANRTSYEVFYRNSTSLWTLWEVSAGSPAALDTDNTDLPATNGWAYVRLYAATSDVRGWAGTAFPLTAVLTSNDNTLGGGTLYDGGVGLSIRKWSFFEFRTDHKITCTGLPADWQLQANASATYKATAVGGTATLDVGMLEWPLTSVEVLDADDAQVAQLDSGDHADMGGGDAFAYEADATGNPGGGTGSGGLQNPFTRGFTGGLR